MSDQNDQPPVTGVPWRRILAEVAAIVFGILIAFAADAEWARRQALAEEQETLASLEADLQSSLDGLLGYWVPLHSGALTAPAHMFSAALGFTSPAEFAVDLATIREVMKSSGEDSLTVIARDYWASLAASVENWRGSSPGSVALSDSLIGAALVTPTHDPTTASLSALLTANGLSQIRSRELRKALSALPAQFADAADEERLARDHVDQRLRPLLSSAGDMTLVNAVHWGWLEDAAPSGRSSVNLELNPELLGAMALRVPQLLAVLGELGMIGVALEETLELIAEQRRQP